MDLFWTAISFNVTSDFNMKNILPLFIYAVLPLVSFPLILLLQVRLGYEVALFPLYMIATGVLAWRFGAYVGALGVIISTGFWTWGVFITDTVYSFHWALYYNIGARLVLYVATVVFVVVFRRIRDRQEQLMENMRCMLNVCNCCGAIQGSNGEWIPLGEIANRKSEEPRMCVSCARSVRG